VKAAACLLIAGCWLGSPAWAAPGASDFVPTVGFDQHLDRLVPQGLEFRDENNRQVRLADYSGGMPLLLVLSYYRCSTLCPTVIANLAAKLGDTGLAAGSQYQVAVVSIDPSDSPALAAARKAAYVASGAVPAEARGWHLLTGSAASAAALADSAGFRYAYDAATQQYAHSAGFVVLTPQGRIARYFFGFDFTPADLRHAVDEASAEHIASPVERLLLLCFHFDPATGRYSADVIWTLRWMGLVMVLTGLCAIWVGMRQPRTGKQSRTRAKRHG
jgi:protein SCO1/2